MSNTALTQLQEGLTTAYIDGTAAANLAYKPAFVSNNPEEGKKVISVIEDELMKCDQFQISVAFIYYGRNYASLADVEGTGEESDSGSDLNEKLS